MRINCQHVKATCAVSREYTFKSKEMQKDVDIIIKGKGDCATCLKESMELMKYSIKYALMSHGYSEIKE